MEAGEETAPEHCFSFVLHGVTCRDQAGPRQFLGPAITCPLGSLSQGVSVCPCLAWSRYQRGLWGSLLAVRDPPVPEETLS